MIRSLARCHGLAQHRTLAHAHAHAYASLPRALAQHPHRAWPARALSDGPRASTSGLEKRADTNTPPPPTPSAPRKPKVALHPAPIRPTSAQRSTPTPGKELKEGEKAQAAARDEALGAEKEGILAMARKDLVDAQAHGVLIPPPEGAGRIGKLWHQAKELFKFYLRGMKLVYTNRQASRAIRQRVESGGEPLTRWEARFIERTKSDVIKVVPFVMIVLIIEEIIPLIVLYAPGMLPSTCVLPSQRARIAAKKREKQAAAARAHAPDLRALLASPRPLTEADRLAPIALLSVLARSTFGTPPMRIRRVETQLQAVAADDARLAAEGAGARLDALELGEALEERGIPNEDLAPEEMRKRLGWWLREAGKGATGGDAVARRVPLVARAALGQF